MTRKGKARRPSPTRLYRDPGQAILAGVCAGLAEYLGVPVLLVRVVTVVGLFTFTLPTLLTYAILALALQRRPADLYADAEEEAFWQGVRTEPRRAARELDLSFQRLERRLREVEACVTSEAFKLNRAFRDLDR
jgi:phage shock protein C